MVKLGHYQQPAALNFGDCFTFAFAQVTGEPLLDKGDDFARTDILATFLPPHGSIADDDG